MAKVNIDGKEYDTEKLPKEAVDLINSIVFVDTELQRLENQKKVLTAARIFYAEKLKEVLSKLEE
ncbi:DUF6447 family protein [Aquifex aeolicus]|uniref:DUF6447 family protein n=1 Tax=Aquifex aeolicus TaxID=63363 RepID=UPI0002DB2D2A|nr:DUF6447 family protein [Aquifex aeolicus]